MASGMRRQAEANTHASGPFVVRDEMRPCLASRSGLFIGMPDIIVIAFHFAWAICTAPSATAADEDAANAPAGAEAAEEQETKEPEKEDAKKWQPLFDGKSLKGWQVTDFAGHGEADAVEGELVLRNGELLTGVTWDNKLFEIPKSNYEISLAAQRVDGSDFFCCLTFPVGVEHCSLVVGGWGGGLVGLSSIDGLDASENSTTVFEKFENKKWYPIRVRVTDAKIQAWIEDRKLIDVDREGKEFSVRWEVEDSRPLGIATYQTSAALKDFKFRKLAPGE